MAARNLAPLRSLNRDIVRIEGSFAPNGTSAVAASSRQGLGWSVARSDVGVFTITLTDKFASLLSAQATVQLGTAADTQAQIGAVDLSAKTVVINILTAGSLADIAADASNRINFELVLRNSQAVPVRGA